MSQTTEPFGGLREVDPERDALSPGASYQDILDCDTREVPEVLRWRSARDLPVVEVPIERYVSREFHDLEMEKLWKRVWQMACREEAIPEPGDHEVLLEYRPRAWRLGLAAAGVALLAALAVARVGRARG